MRFVHNLLVLVVCFVAVDCTCGKPPIVTKDRCLGVSGSQSDNPNACTDSTECSEHYSCKDVKEQEGLKCCVFLDRACTTEADCCPGQTCPADRKKCFDKFVACEKDADCGDKGDRVCENYTDIYGSSSRCRLKPCGALGECPAGQACFQGECITGLPCDGTCEAGKACVASVNRCQDYANPTGREMAACPMSCAPGFLATFKDARNIWDSCNLPPVACVCAELPGLISNDLGRFSSIGAEPTKAIYVSSYDGQFGDLVVKRFGLDGVQTASEYVDGVPTGKVTYGPSGARGGVVEPGPDVGRYTDLVVGADGTVLVSYYDVTNGDLKVGTRSTTGTWTTHKVDGADANVGLYSSIALDSDGFPGISYFQSGADAAFDASTCPGGAPTGAKAYITALRYAKSNTKTPKFASDWAIKTLACLSRPPPPCEGCTATCADPGTGPACLQPGTGCSVVTVDGGVPHGCDANTQVCVVVGGMNTCGNKYNPSNLVEVPVGVGLFSSLAFNGKAAVITYMKRNAPTVVGGLAKGDLYAIPINAAGMPSAPILLDANGDTGYFTDVKFEPTTHAIAIGYHDFSSKQFKFYYAPQLQAGVTPEVIDKGTNPAIPGELNFVGTDSAIVFGNNQIFALYQDATRGDLKMARRGASWQVLASPATAGAVGFFADAVFTDGKLYASHAQIHAKIVSQIEQVDNTLHLEVLPAN